MSRIRAAAAALSALSALGALGVLLAGCGTGGGNGSLQQARSYATQDGTTIAGDARGAMQSLRTMHVSGRIGQDPTPVDLDLSVSRSGDCAGTVGIGGGHIELRSVGGKAWFKADDAFWQFEAGDNAARVAQVVAGRWVVLSGRLEQLRSFCRIDQLTGQMLGAKARVRPLGAVMVGTTPTVRLAVTEAGVTETAYVVAAEPHYVLRIQRTGAGAGQVTFSAFDQPLRVTAPPARQVFDLSRLER